MANHDDLGFVESNHDDLGFVSSEKEQTPSSVSYLESLLRGGAQGATLGFADELAGAGESLLDPEGNYSKYRDESRAAFDAAQEANPWTYGAGQLAGGILPAFATPAATGFKGMLGVGAGMGALTGAGTSTADLTQGDVGGFAKDVGSNAAVGGVLNASLGSLLSKLSPSALEKTAAERAVKATGANKSQIKNLLKAPASDSLAIQELMSSGVSKEEATKMIAEKGGNRLLEHGKNLIGKNPYQDKSVVTAGANAEDILERSQDLKQKVGESIGNTINKLDSKYSIENPDIRKLFFNPEDAISKIKELQNQFVKNGEVVPLSEATAGYKKLQEAIDTVSQYGNKPINFSEANVLKGIISKTAYKQDGSLDNELMAQVRGIINDGIEDAADAVTQATKDPELYKKYLQDKDLYRTANDSINAALGKTAGELVNRDLGITDYMAGGIAAASHGSPTALATMGLHKLAKTYGNSITASTANAGANVGKALAKVSTDVLKSSGERLIASGGQLEGKLGRVLIEASGRDGVGRNAVIFSLSQNPAYRQLLTHLVPSDDIK